MRDIKDAVRHLTHRPGSTVTILLTLALGVGVNALVFSAVRAVLLRPLPFAQPQQLVALWETQPGVMTRGVAPANFLDWRGASSFDSLAAYNGRRRSLGGDDPERISIATVSANFFTVLGVQPSLGRTFGPTIASGTMREIVLREDLWRRRFAGDRSIVGRSIRLDDETLLVAGILPTHLGFPEEAVAWTQAPYDVPELSRAPADIRVMRDAWYFRVVGRLQPGVTRAQAQAEMDGIAARLREVHPATNRNAGVNVVDLHTQVTGASASTLWMLFAVVGCVLAVACGNVATLLLAGAVGRRRDLAIRAALGASRARLVRQLTTESLLLALGGAAIGLMLAWAARPAMLALLPPGLPRTSTIGIDAGVVWFTLGIALATAMFFGVVPSIIASRVSVFTTLRDGGRGGASRGGSRAAAVLVVGQLATALVLVTGTVLMLRTVWNLYQRDVGIDVDRLLALDVNLPDARSRGRAAAALDVQRMVERLGALPGVTAAAAVQTLPLAARGPSAGLRVEGRAFAPNEAPDVVWRPITPDYFRATGAAIVRGRGFTDADRDGTEPVTVINATLARLLWPDADPIGRRIGTGLDGDGAPVVIVGVVGDIPQEGIGATVLPEMYRPLAQPARFGVDSMSLVVRTDGDPAALGGAAKQAVREVHASAPVSAVRPMTTIVADGIASEVAAMRALAVFGALALALAAVGLYGVMTRLVGDRTRELGVRLALGAEPGAIRRLVLGRTLALSAGGVVIGAGASAVVSRQLGALLHGNSPVDPVVFALAAAVLVAAALGASYWPARRASRIDPLIVLKSD